MWYVVEDTRQFVRDMLSSKPKIIAVDTETYYRPELLGNAVTKYPGGHENNAPFGVSIATHEHGYWITKDFSALRPLLANEQIEKILHNAKYDMHMLQNIGIPLKGFIWDTMMMIHLINEELEVRTPNGSLKKSKKLKDLAYHYLGDDGHLYENKILELKKQIAKDKGCTVGSVSYKDISDRSPQDMADYAISDTDFTFRLWEIFLPELIAQNLLEPYKRDLAALHAIYDMERNGIQIAREQILKVRETLIKEQSEIEAKLYALAGGHFNINSAKELVAGYEKLGLAWKWFTDKNELSTNKLVMEHLQTTHCHQIKKMVEGKEEKIWVPDDDIGAFTLLTLMHRDVRITIKTFIDNVIKYTDKITNRVHPDFNLCPRDDGSGATVTGRISSSDPNLQNITKKHMEIRKCVVAKKGYIIVEMDYSQQEYRLLAHYSGDPDLIRAIENGWDIHKATAAMLFNKEYDDVTEGERKAAKSVNFGLVYGLGDAAFAHSKGYTIDEAMYYRGMDYLRAKGIKPWDEVAVSYVLGLYPNDEKAHEAINYYYSEEARLAISKAKADKREYFDRFPRVQMFLDEVKAVCKQRGYIRYWSGRRRHFKSPKSDAYKAPNSLIQGGCGEITKEKLAKCYQFLKENDYKSRIINSVHDSILFEIHIDEIDLITDLQAILDDNNFKVPIVCEMEWGFNWGEMKKHYTVEDIRRCIHAEKVCSNA